MSNRIKITVKWNDENSITSAENTKFDLENRGYQIVDQYSGLNETIMIFELTL